MNKHWNKLALGASLALVALPALVFAITIQGPPGNITKIEDLLDKICSVVNIMFTVLIIVAVVMVMYAAFLYLTAQGDPEKVKSANHTIIYAAIAIAVGIFSKGIPIMVATFLGGVFNGCA